MTSSCRDFSQHWNSRELSSLHISSNQVGHQDNIIFRPPDQLGAYSVITDLKERKRKFCEQFYSQFKQLSLPSNPTNVHFDLLANYDFYAPYFPLSFTPYLDDFLEWILHNRQLFALHNERSDHQNTLKSLNTDFICFRGTLTTIMTSPYEQAGWRIVAHLFKGTIYLMLVKEQESYEPYVLKCIYGGYQFEEYVTAGIKTQNEEEEEEEESSDLSLERKEFCCAYRTRMGPHSIVYAAEIDCFERKLDENVFRRRTPARQVKAVEVKTSAQITADFHLVRFKKKIVRWWAQAQLVDCSYVVCGFRNRNHCANQVVVYTLDDLIRLGTDYWNPTTCRSFLYEFLNFVKQEMQNRSDNGKKDNFCMGFQYESSSSKVKVIDFPPSSVLPDWFQKEFK